MPVNTTLPAVDDILGPAAQRFFGRGFRRVGYDVEELTAGCADQVPWASASVDVSYPGDWSRKAVGTDLRPHFSTIDALVLGAQLAEHCLQSPGQDPAVLANGWLRKVRITAGSKPQEDLAGLKATARRKSVTPAEEDGWTVSVFDSAIGAMRVQSEIVHPAAELESGEWTAGDLPQDRYYGAGFKARTQWIRDLEVQDQTKATAVLELSDDGEASANGLEGAYHPAPSMVDAFVTALQLAQVMMYDLDGVPRQASDTLWMRQTTMTAPKPSKTREIPVTTELADPALLQMGGDTWRTFTVLADVAGISVRSAVTHRLPGSA
ncbi:AvrD family protein [Kribbella sp. NPDC051718]|uniref:AvrD family protein n=1 Tax=Kribbella sp. NPDC051718 TaxID=3155168 RepID=UPI00342FC35D